MPGDTMNALKDRVMGSWKTSSLGTVAAISIEYCQVTGGHLDQIAPHAAALMLFLFGLLMKEGSNVSNTTPTVVKS